MKTGYVAIAGRPNVGKSTLLNKLLGVKLSAVSRRPQTTRQRVLGIDNGDEYQIVFLDTPGLLDPQYALQKKLLKIARQSIEESDVLLFMIDARNGINDEDAGFLRDINKKNVIGVINKIDLVEKDTLLQMIDKFNKLTSWDDIYPVSAIKGFGLTELRQGILAKLPVGPAFYDSESLTDQPEKFFVAEIIREKIFELCGAEVPYATAVVIDQFREQSGRKDVISATVWVERDSQKGILIGQGGRKMKAIGSSARKDIEIFLDRPVFLEMFVKVKEKWRSNERDLQDLGF
jgi:GTP-binding protein Era